MTPRRPSRSGTSARFGELSVRVKDWVTEADASPETQARLIGRWRREEQQPFRGWDFAYLEGRMLMEQPPWLPPWSYAQRAAELWRGASSVVDLGTGGGERLLELREAWPARVTATEEHPPN